MTNKSVQDKENVFKNIKFKMHEGYAYPFYDIIFIFYAC